MQRNLTRGSIFCNIMIFSIPYLISCFLQMLYGLGDLFIIGQFAGVDSTTAVSIGSQVMHMVTVIITGLAMGSTVMIGRSVGEENPGKVSITIGNTVRLFALIAAAMSLLLLLLVKPITYIVRTPEEAISSTRNYLVICFLGIPFITAYNILSSIFQGMGDTKSPMYFIFVACVLNIALDYLFIGGFGLGAVGAALGTTLSQAFSVVIAFIAIRHRKMFTISRSDLRKDEETVHSIMHVGLPIALQNGFIQVSFLFITAIANMRGLEDAAAVGIVEKIMGMLFLVPSALLSSVSAISSINLGAGYDGRARSTLWTSIGIAIFFGMLSGVVIQFISEDLVSLFATDIKVIVGGGQYLRGYVWDSLFAGIHFCFSGYFSALGKSKIAFYHNMVGILLARAPIAYVASAAFPSNLLPMGLATVIGSIISCFICLGCYIYIRRKEKDRYQS